jgi:hypothetical protein
MTTPVQPNSSTLDPSIHYDAEAGMCVAPPAVCAAPPAQESGPIANETEQASSAAVARLVKNAPAERNCHVSEAAYSCGKAAILALAATRAPATLAVTTLTILECGNKVMNTVECLSK